MLTLSKIFAEKSKYSDTPKTVVSRVERELFDWIELNECEYKSFRITHIQTNLQNNDAEMIFCLTVIAEVDDGEEEEQES